MVNPIPIVIPKAVHNALVTLTPLKWSKGGWLTKTMTGYIIGYKFHFVGYFVLGIIVSALIGAPIINHFSNTVHETQYKVRIF